MHGQLNLPGAGRKCRIPGFEPEGGACPICKGSMKVRVTTYYEAVS